MVSNDLAAAVPVGTKTGPSSTMTQFARVCIDNDGDLLLRVGAIMFYEWNPVEFKVCSAAMRRASPVWKSMLFGPWTEAKPPCGDWVVDLPEDEWWPIEIILRIVHGIFEKVPNFVSLSQLNSILIHTDKYDLMHVIRPWAGAWVKTVRDPTSYVLPIVMSTYRLFDSPSNNPKLTGRGHIARMHAAWELGCEDVVAGEITNLIFNLSVAGEAIRYKTEQLRFDSHFGPPDLLEIVTELRLSLIQSLLDFYHDVVQSRMSGKSACRYQGYHSQTRTFCDSAILGGIWREMGTAVSMPESAVDYHDSANGLMEMLSGMFNRLPCLDSDHQNCSPAKKYSELELKTKQDERWKDVLHPHHKERMAARRKKTGL